MHDFEFIFNLVFVFIVSISIGSFLNVVIYRMTKGESVVGGRSYCPKCNNQLKSYHNIPIFAWIFLKGKCGFCKEPISIQYPLVELLIGILGVSCFSMFGINVYSIMTFLTFTTLFAIAAIDFKYKMVPDSLSILALLFAVFHTEDILTSIQFALLGIGAFSTIRIVGDFVFNKEVLGEGDLLIVGTMGAMLPSFSQLSTAIFITAMIALLPSIYTRIKSKDFQLKIDERFLKIDEEICKMELVDKDDVIYQEKMSLLRVGIDNLKMNSNSEAGIPFIPFLFLGLLITFFFNLNFYI